MQGEYRGDFTRDTFDRRNRFARVLMQQGRVQLDADWNEQASILLYYLRTLGADLIGPYGGPDDGFFVTNKDVDKKDVPSSFLIRNGHYYVDGILCENEQDFLPYAQQPAYPLLQDAPLSGGPYLIYLDVWERHITCVENDNIREVALGGPDAATRAQVVWQVKGRSIDNISEAETSLQNLISTSKAALRARTVPKPVSTSPCTFDPAARYRGLENQLYRVEIHHGTSTADATFKWSRDNGSVVFPIVNLEGSQVEVANLGRDDSRSLNVNDWVEIVDDDLALRGEPGLLRQVAVVKREDLLVTLNQPVPNSYTKQSTNHPLLRRWDHRGKASELQEGALLVSEGEGDDQKHWITLEAGIQIQFRPAAASESNNYRPGDYWLIPARTATGNLEWPQQLNAGTPETYGPGGNPIPAAREPHGVEHHYAPLAALKFDGSGKVTGPITDLRRIIKPIAKP